MMSDIEGATLLGRSLREDPKESRDERRESEEYGKDGGEDGIGGESEGPETDRVSVAFELLRVGPWRLGRLL